MLAGVVASLLSVAVALVIPANFKRLGVPPRRTITANKARRVVGYQTVMVAEEVKRKVYPYSIVPGGAENVNEAKHFMADPAIKVHYANMDLGQLRQERLATNLTGYVSYRWGEKIYWTAKKITLRAGETVFTDGTHVVRGRCLNCYSALPMLPTRSHEPTEIVMNTPVEMPVTVYSFPQLPLIAPELPIPPGELTPTVPVLPVAAATIGKIPGGGFPFFPIIPIIPPIHHHPSRPPTGPSTPLVPPVVVIPEPHYGTALALGFIAMLAAFTWRRRSFSKRQRSSP